MALLLVIIYAVVRIFLMVLSLQSTMAEVEKLKTAAHNKDLATLSAGLGKAADAIGMGDSSAHDPVVQFFGFLPIIGADIHAASVLSSDGRLVLQAAQDVTNVSNQLVKAGIGQKPLQNPALVASMREGMSSMNTAVQQLNDDLTDIDPAALHFGLTEKMTSAKTAVASLANASSRITPLV